jgi:hypothetical protein
LHLISYASDARELVIVRHRAGYPEGSKRKEDKHSGNNYTILIVPLWQHKDEHSGSKYTKLVLPLWQHKGKRLNNLSVP